MCDVCDSGAVAEINSESARSDWRQIQIQDGRWQCTIVA